MIASANIHASCVVLAGAGETLGAARGAGVLLLGESGAGKSDLALRLIANGAILVADDRCELLVEDAALCARAPRSLAGLIEVRGVGIVAVSCLAQARIALVARLVTPKAIARLPEPGRYQPPPELAVPKTSWPPEIAIAPFEASATAKIAAAAAALAGGGSRGTTSLA